MRFRIVKNAWWMFWAWGMVVWPWMWLKKDHADDERLFRHELQHCYQCARMGRLKFYGSYLLLLIRHGYKEHPYEVEAREYENEPLTEIERVWFEKGKVG